MRSFATNLAQNAIKNWVKMKSKPKMNESITKFEGTIELKKQQKIDREKNRHSEI